MKKYMFGLIALVIASASVAFTTKDTKFTDYYWAYNAAGTSLVFPSTPPPTTNPVSCNGTAKNCAESYTAYFQDTDGLYKPVNGTFVANFKKP